jgi:hypothetical protein
MSIVLPEKYFAYISQNLNKRGEHTMNNAKEVARKIGDKCLPEVT